MKEKRVPTHRRHVRLLFLLRRGRTLKSRCIASLLLVQPGDVVEAWDVHRIRQSCGKTWHVTSLIPGVGRELVLLGGGLLFHSPLVVQRSLEHLLLLPLRQLVLGELQRHHSSWGSAVQQQYVVRLYNRCLFSEQHGGKGGGTYEYLVKKRIRRGRERIAMIRR